VGKKEDGAIAMIHDFTLVYALSPELNSQDEVMHRLAGSDCADATVGWGGLGMSLWPSAGRRWIAMRQWLWLSLR
jgi:hypothetical protein